VQVRADIKENTRRLKIAKRNLRIAKEHLASFLVSSYKGDTSDLYYVLGSGSFTDLIDRVEYVQRMSDAEGELLAEVQKAEHEIQVRQAKLKVDEKKSEKLVAEATQHKADIQAAVNARQQMLGGLQSDLAQAIRDRQARLDRIAREKAAALAAAQQQQEQAAATAAAAASSGGGGGNIPVPPSSTLGGQAVAIAERYLGVPYVWGGASPSGFDCSGLTMYVYSQLGVSLPHNAAAQYLSLPHVSESDLQPGDLVFFDGLNHVGIYIGGGSIIHAPHTGTVVQISSLSGGGSYYGAARVPG